MVFCSANPQLGHNRSTASILEQIPIGASISFIISLLSLFSCIAILIFSDQKPIETWPISRYPIQPSVLLSISTAIANLSIRCMFDEGVTIAWWKKAVNGSTVGELHRSWAYGHSLVAVLKTGRHFNLIALASIFATIVSIDGPLLQRASKVVTVPWSDTPLVNVRFSANLSMKNHPTGYSTGRTSEISMLSQEFLPVMRDWSARRPMYLNYTGCSGTCITEIVGPGLDVQCNASISPLNVSLTPGDTTGVLNFTFEFDGKLGDPGEILLHTNLRKTGALNRSTINDCSLRLAQVRHLVQLQVGTVQLLPTASGANNTVAIQQLYMETTGEGRFNSTMGGLYLIASTRWAGDASLYMNGSPFELEMTGEAPLEYMQYSGTDGEDYSWRDPTDDFISGMQELIFRAAIAASNTDNSTTQTVTTTQGTQRTIYVSHYQYLCVAFAVMTAAIIATSINLFGWWTLGRKYTLGPFEIAKAFNGPSLHDAQFAGTSENGFKEVQDREIRYGELTGLEIVDVNDKLSGSGDDVEGFGGEERSIGLGTRTRTGTGIGRAKGEVVLGMGALRYTKSIKSVKTARSFV